MIEAAKIQGVRRARAMQKRSSKDFQFLLAVALAHLPLGVAIYLAGSLALLHPIAIFGVGLYLAVNKRYRLELVTFAIAYLVGAEVLWRMAQVPVYWEFGKYGSVLIAVVALVTRQCYSIPKLPFVYLAALVPGSLLTLFERDFSSAQSTLSTQISGPFFLVISCWLFSYCKFDQITLRYLLTAIVAPLFSVAFATFFFTVSTENIQFSGESNFATSGGFGPNQVSAMLGLGAFISLACLLIFQNTVKFRIFFMIVAVLFAGQSVMTFSRGGIYNALGGIIVIAFVEFRNPKVAAKRLIPIAALAVLFLALVFPVLDNFTGGQLRERFEDTGTASRTEIAGSDVQLFLDNPFMGVGVGNSYTMRESLLDRKAMTHTEFSRLPSEHGIFGVIALVMLASMIVLNFKKQRSLLGKAIMAGTAAWCCLFMTNAAMRLAAPAFLWGLMYATIAVTRQAPRRAASPRLSTAPEDEQPVRTRSETETDDL